MKDVHWVCDCSLLTWKTLQLVQVGWVVLAVAFGANRLTHRAEGLKNQKHRDASEPGEYLTDSIGFLQGHPPPSRSVA